MKHTICIFTCLWLLLTGFTSCNSGKKVYRIGVLQSDQTPWRQQMNDEMKKEATFYEEQLAFSFCSASNDCDRQIRQIDSMVHAGVDLLVISPTDARKLTPVIEKVWNSGIPVIIAHQKILSDQYTAYIGADNQELGHDVASFIAKNLGRKGVVVELMDQPESSVTKERHASFIKKMADFPQMQVAASVYCPMSHSNVRQIIDSLYLSGIRPDAIFAHFNYTGLKAYEATRKHHESPIIVGIDGAMGRSGGLQNVENGKLLASFIYPSGGAEVVRVIIRILRDEPYDWKTILHTAVITNENKQAFRMQTDQLKEREQKIELLDVKFDHLLSRSSMQHMLLISCVIIILLIGLALVIGLRSYYIIIRHNEKLGVQKQKLEEQRDRLLRLSKELKETTHSKLQFFTQVAHEFRTPLTLILGPAEELEHSPLLQGKERNLLHIIHSNTDILLRLINQCIDFRKMESGKLKLNLQYMDLTEQFELWCKPFKALAQKRMIRYHYQFVTAPDAHQPVCGWFDAAKLESILYNLIDNALKFTPEGGKVSITAAHQAEGEGHHILKIVVEDTGKGIAEEAKEHIFDLFYQSETTHGGSGIGLTASKFYAEMHGGTLRAENMPERGARFILEIPYEAQADWKEETTETDNGTDSKDENLTWPSSRTVGVSAATTPDNPADDEQDSLSAADSEAIPELDGATLTQSSATVAERAAEPDNPTTDTAAELLPGGSTSARSAEGHPDLTGILPEGKSYTLLIIEDNKDMLDFIGLALQGKFHVEVAETGKEGIGKALQLLPDLIVCDLAAPEMDGAECCKRLKNDTQTAHIPVIVLTNGALEEEHIRCLEYGADAHLNKPFNRYLFLISIHNLIANRQRSMTFFGDRNMQTADSLNDWEKGFTERFKEVIENNLNDPGLSVETIAIAMGIGRSQLYRKVKSVTGFTPIEVIRIARLKKAAEILKRTDHSVSEVAYEVGFSSPSYFAKCFNDYFGTSPSNYTRE